MVNVGHPHVEGHGAELECQTGNDEDQAKDQHLVAHLAGVDGLEHFTDVQRTGCAIHHGHAIQQKTAGHGTQHKVLHGSFGRSGMLAAQCHQSVAGQREQFQTQVQHQEVVAADHHEHAQQREQGKREKFAATAQHVPVGCIATAIHQRHHHCHRGKTLEPVAHGVAYHHVAKAIEGIAAAGIEALQHCHNAQREQGKHVGTRAAWAGHAQIDECDHTGHDQKHNLRVNRQPTDFVNHLGSLLSVQFSLDRATCRSSSVTELSITSVKGRG